MSTAGTVRMLRKYEEGVEAPMFLSGFFQTPPENFHRSEKVEVDVIRSEPNIAIPIQGIGAGAREISMMLYTNKGYTPPVYDNEATISAYNMLKRRAGMTPFQDPNFLEQATNEAFRHMRVLEALIRRAVEYQASQVLSSGTLALLDSDGNEIYAEDFAPKASHFPTVGTTWGAGGDDPMDDLASLARVIRRDGKVSPNRLVFGRNAYSLFTDNAKVQSLLDNRRMEIGRIAPAPRGSDGATLAGEISIQGYDFEVWLYDEEFIDPQTGTHTPYVDPDHVLMLSSRSRLDLTFGDLPMFVPPDSRVTQFLPGRFSFEGQSMDLSTNAWITPDGKHLKLSVGTRPLCIPTAIDSFGRLDVTA